MSYFLLGVKYSHVFLLTSWQMTVPSPTRSCVAIPTYDSVGDMEMLELNTVWSSLMVSTWCTCGTAIACFLFITPQTSTEITPGISAPVLGCTVNYTSHTWSTETVSPSSCDSQCRHTLSGDVVSSDITTVTVWAWNSFGRGEETLCNKYNISKYSNTMSYLHVHNNEALMIMYRYFKQHCCSGCYSHYYYSGCLNPMDEQKSCLPQPDPNILQ